MLIEHVLGKQPSSDLGSLEIQLIQQSCPQYLKESAGLPLFKLLPATYEDFQKVKVRLQKHRDPVNEAFDKAFGEQFVNLRQRAIFANPTAPTLTEGFEPFYIFPIDGYRYLYSKVVSNSGKDYQYVIETLLETLTDQQQVNEIVIDILKKTYATEQLTEGISSESEIIFYGIPFYYAVRASAVQDYTKTFIK